MVRKKERLREIEKILNEASEPIPGVELAERFNVSRQVIVQDISLLRAQNLPILSTHTGYRMDKEAGHSRVLKLHHRDDQIVDELTTIVDLGGRIDDVFVEHRIYGKISAIMDIKSRKDIKDYMELSHNSVSTPLKNITNNYHFHTISADDEETLDLVEDALTDKGYLVS